MTHRSRTQLLVAIGLIEGLFPLLARGLFDGRTLLAPAVHLPAPWWWLVSASILVACVVGIVVVNRPRAGST
jgi:hypothetical protein